ncbi:SAM-dependent methyltransferase [Angustibacter aerolatus]
MPPTWRRAWHDALYGSRGFYRQDAGPAAHFRTSATASPLLGAALARLCRELGLGALVDVGAGRGELLPAVRAADPELRLTGLDAVERLAALSEAAGWVRSPGGEALPDLRPVTAAGALVVAHEWLDVVPCSVLEREAAGTLREIEVDRDGTEHLGRPADAEDVAWCDRWWPGARVEVGRSRDAAWAALVDASPGCVLLAVDYAHDAADRPPHGTLAAYRDGRLTDPVPDGGCDLTAHVALDAVAAAGEAAGATTTVRTTQRSALRTLGVDVRLPDPASASRDPSGYLAALQAASLAGELLHPAGLGGFGWLLQSTRPAGQDGPALERLATS